MPRGRKRALKKKEGSKGDAAPLASGPGLTLAGILPPTGKGKKKSGASAAVAAVTTATAPSPPIPPDPKPKKPKGSQEKIKGGKGPVKQTETIKEERDLPLISSIGGAGGRKERRSYSVAFASDVGLADEEDDGQCACESPNREMGTQADLLITSSKELLDKYVQEYDGKSPIYPNNRYAQLVGPIVLSSDMEDDEDDKLQPHLLPSLDEHEMSFLQDLSKSRSLDPHDL